MKSFIAFALVVAVAAAASLPDSSRDATIVKQHSDNIGVDGYRFGYETSNGIIQQEEAQLKNVGTENEAIEVRGQFSYPGPDGVLYTVNFIANELGFQPQAAHLPVGPTA